MVYDILRLPVYGLLTLILVFNLSQRRHLEHGERKRFASLKIAGVVLLFALELFLIQWFKLSPLFTIFALAVAAGVGYALRSSFAAFRFHCVNCGRPLPLKRALYYDDNLCPACALSHQTLTEAGERSRQFPEGVPESVDKIDWDSWEPDESAVLCFVMRGEELLLIHKKMGLGAGKVNAPGGRIEPGETAHDAAVRETTEEVGVVPEGLEKRVDLSFIFTNGYSLRGSVFFATGFSGTPEETAEAVPFWCNTEEIPYEKMWEDDKEWLPRALSGELLDARFIFDGERMVSKRIEQLT